MQLTTSSARATAEPRTLGAPQLTIHDMQRMRRVHRLTSNYKRGVCRGRDRQGHVIFRNKGSTFTRMRLHPSFDGLSSWAELTMKTKPAFFVLRVLLHTVARDAFKRLPKRNYLHGPLANLGILNPRTLVLDTWQRVNS